MFVKCEPLLRGRVEREHANPVHMRLAVEDQLPDEADTRLDADFAVERIVKGMKEALVVGRNGGPLLRDKVAQRLDSFGGDVLARSPAGVHL